MMDRYFRTDAVIERTHTDPIPNVRLLFSPFRAPAHSPGRPWHPHLIGSGAVLLIATLSTDLIYMRTLLFQWENFSIWLLTGGLVLAALGGVTLILDILLHRVARIDWERFTGLAVAAMLSLLNAFVHSRDAYTAVVPQGIVLSASVAILLVFIGWWGWSVSAPPSSH
jgi:uncharacterized membrane protein